jgi:hypothetical protein
MQGGFRGGRGNYKKSFFGVGENGCFLMTENVSQMLLNSRDARRALKNRVKIKNRVKSTVDLKFKPPI